MFFEQIFSEGLAHNSYLIGDQSWAAVIDPQRDAGIYPVTAARHRCMITHIFETHRHEDFVSGSVGLAGLTGAEICHGAALDFAFGRPVRTGDRFVFGGMTLDVLETPGHTEESISLVVRDTVSGDDPLLVFCGDTIFAGDIARTDFYGNERKAEMAAKIFDSITRKILPLGDGVILCPAHGAGSVCGSGETADRPFTTVGYEKATNPLIRMGREAFIARRITESPYYAPYFRTMEVFNRNGSPPSRDPPRIRLLSVRQLADLNAAGCQILDIRSPGAFGCGHIPGSLSLWRRGVAAFAGWVLNYHDPVVIIDDFNTDIGPVAATLNRMGYDTIAGILDGGAGAWFSAGMEIGTSGSCSVRQLAEEIDKSTPFILDVRDIRHRRTDGWIPGSHHIYVGELPGRLDKIPADVPVYVYCDAGYKGSLAASILLRNHFTRVTNVLGGMTAWTRAGYRIEREGKSPSAADN